jgi:uncharacterized protein YfaS (alpha-2-macroglobulin family)
LSAQPAYASDEKITLPLRARYYFGKPLNRAKVHWSLQLSDFNVSPDGFAEFQFGEAGEGYGESQPMEMNFSGEAELDAQGQVAIAMPVSTNAQAAHPMNYLFVAEVTDLNQQTISADAAFIQHSSEFYLGIKRPRNVLAAGETVPLEVVAVKPDGTPWTAPVSFHAKLSKIKWRSVAKQGAGNALVYENVQDHELVTELDGQSLPLQKIGVKWETPPDTRAPLLRLKEPGEYAIEITAKDSAGHLVKSELWVDVSGEAKLGWNYRNPVQIDLVPDKPLYLPGATATVLIKTPIDGQALVTIERDKVLRSFVEIGRAHV